MLKNISVLQEPELQFFSNTHLDVRFGLMNFGALDHSINSAPKTINLGLIGISEDIQLAREWFNECQKGFPAKKSKQPNLFPRFPGYGPDSESLLPSNLILDSRLEREIARNSISRLLKAANHDELCRQAAEMFLQEMEYLSEKTNANVMLIIIPQEILDRILTVSADKAIEDIDEDLEGEEIVSGISRTKIDLHNLIKAKAMGLRIPTQIVKPSTLVVKKSKSLKIKYPTSMQDVATRAWNLYVAIYYKAGGIPWRLIRNPSDFTTFYIGVSFYKSLDETTVQTSIAQVFNERGEGVIVRGEKAIITKTNRQPHLSKENSYSLLRNALAIYKREHGNLPARVVVHKSSEHNEDEIEGFSEALREYEIERSDFVSIRKTFSRLFRYGEYPPLRGTYWPLTTEDQVLYTRGSVHFFKTYPGMYVPRPLLIKMDKIEQAQQTIVEEVLALTKMNWNNTQFDGGWPITLRAARQVGSILKYVSDQEVIHPRYSYYM